MNKHLLDPEIFSRPNEWPRCPKCGSRDVLVANVRQYCLNCPERTPLGSMRGQVGPHLLAVSLLQIPEQEMPAVQFGPFPQTVDPDFGHVLHYRRAEAFCDSVLDPIIEKARAYHTRHGNFPSVGLTFETLLSKPVSYDLDADAVDDLIAKGRAQAKGKNAVADLFLTHASGPVLGAYFECYGTPGIFRKHLLTPTTVDQIELNSTRQYLYQPLHWPLFTVDTAHHTLHYAAALEARGTSNACLAVTESLDSGAVAFHQVLRQPGDPAVVSRKEKEFATPEEAVAAARARFKKLTGLIEPESQVFSFEREFGLERSQMSVLGELMGLEIWEVYKNERNA